ncbi:MULTISPECIES: D-alanine--D-alanine ligase [Flagellimonas]|uniref:D-alanine--D-alanine ligase n=1 Tax=Flagellimonas hadalis TaxID=2597517 RepID=A0A5N5IS96_9FLAO|nr:D-alanine--D-alanine ligase [Allomuricauda hadalis]KAB5486489.1 D-alanine--D-alanine ligase [Allomuricauda hadalis]
MVSLKLKWHKLTHWEYWPLWVIYYPLFPVWLYYSLKAGSFFFFNAANPSMKNGGMAMESKMSIYGLIPRQYIPNTVFLSKDEAPDVALGRIRASGITYPFIVKPDIGMKSFGVEKIHDELQFREYVRKTPSHYLAQELIPYGNEVGVFYVRKPGEALGKVTGIVSKEFLSVVGDGKSTVLELIKKNPRSHLQLHRLEKKLGERLYTVLEEGDEYILVPYGSHTRGAKFVDISHQLNDALTKTINEICTPMEDFHYGRLDVLYHTFDDLCQGKNFSVIEINGAGGEATHIYDPKHSLWFAWKEITRHWGMMCEVSMLNHQKGHSYLSFRDGRAMLRENGVLQAQLETL